jgi:Eukaryotic mitochondrial regulator protein
VTNSSNQGKPLAKPYASAVLSMLPTTRPGAPHENLNDLPVHASTTSQLFWPVSESRAFTRADAGEAFERGLLPAEKRIPHPQMVRMLNDATLPTNARERVEELQRQMREQDTKAEDKARGKHRRRVQNTTRVQGKRADFCFENVVVNEASVGRTTPGIGSRYGVPHQDRKKGEVKIPRSVE